MEVWNKDEGVPDTRVLTRHEARFGQLAGTFIYINVVIKVKLMFLAAELKASL